MNKIIKNIALWTVAAVMPLSTASCSDEPEVSRWSVHEPVVTAGAPDEGIHTMKAPLYWTVYEYLWKLERQGVPSSQMDITEKQWDLLIDWFCENLKPYGYDMLCTDGFLTMKNEGQLYMTHYGSMDIAKLAQKCKDRGIRLGIYDNPMWLRNADTDVIPGTEYTIRDLKYTRNDKVNHRNSSDKYFNWAIATHPGCKEYIDGFFKYYSELGVNYIRIDFLSWYEDGEDRGMGIVGRGYGRENYKLALEYIKESAAKYDVFVSLVMPNCFNNAEYEREYGHMFRVVADTYYGGWAHFSSNNRRRAFGRWPNCDNMFDGFIYWSKVAGRGRVIMDGDFTRLNTFETDEQKQSVISLQLLAGGPIAVADWPFTVGDNMPFYQNEELLALNTDRFAGRPLTDNLIDQRNQIWYGQMTNGDWVVGLFNRDETPMPVTLHFSELGLQGAYKMRDLWTHTDEGSAEGVEVTLPAYGCKILRLSR